MNSRERITTAFAHREPDRTPVFEYVLLSPIADQILGHPYAGDPANWKLLVSEIGWENAVRQNASDRVELAVALGHDMMYVTGNPMPPADTGNAATEENGAADPVEKIRRRNESYTGTIRRPDERFLIYSFIKEEMRKRDLDLMILAPAYAHGVWTDIDLMQTMLLEPEVAHRHFEIATERSLSLIEKYIELELEMIGVGGDFAGNQPLISPDSYKTFIVPEVRKLSRRIHEAGAYSVNASDGNLWSVLDSFISGCEVDGYLEIDLHAGMELGKLKKEYGDKVTFFGNLDCGNTLSFGTEDEVREHTRTCIEDGMGNGGHILCASNAITSSVPLANYITLVNTYRDMFDLPLFQLK